MKPSTNFEKTIFQHLEKLAQNDPLFAQTFAKPNKNIAECCAYILNVVYKSGQNGFADDEVFEMAVHYYDEDEIEIGGELKAKVIINRNVPLTEDELKEAKQKAIDQVISAEKNKLQNSGMKKAVKTDGENVQTKLF
jgi:hypothetical protein